MSADTVVSVVIVDDHPIFRAGLREVLHAGTRYRVIAEFGDGVTALDGLRGLKPAIALLDLEMPGMSGLDVATQLCTEAPDIAVVLLTMHDEEHAVRRAVQLGVRGYVLKDNAVLDLLTCLDVVSGGDVFISSSLSGFLLPEALSQQGRSYEDEPKQELSASERRVLRLIAASRSSNEIADELFISVRTVHHHRENIARKLGLRGHNALMRYALENKSFL
jgi:two-component system, NarL family, response regulator DegU